MTAQFAEEIAFQGMALQMLDTPLDLWLEISGQHKRFFPTASALERGYVGYWQVLDHRLYLVGIDGIFKNNCRPRLSDLFPGAGKRVFAHWVTREVRCPRGRMLRYSHAGFGSEFERDLFLRFKQGVLMGTREVVNGVSTDSRAPTRYGPGAMVVYGSNPNFPCRR